MGQREPLVASTVAPCHRLPRRRALSYRGVRAGELGKGQGVKLEGLREEKIVLVLSCHSGEVRGLFCKNARARDFPVAGRRRVGRTTGRARESVFLFHEELEIVF